MFRLDTEPRRDLSHDTTVTGLPKLRLDRPGAQEKQQAKPAEVVKPTNRASEPHMKEPMGVGANNRRPDGGQSVDGWEAGMVGVSRVGMVFEAPSGPGANNRTSEGGRSVDGWEAGMVGGRFIRKQETAAPTTSGTERTQPARPEPVVLLTKKVLVGAGAR